MPKYARNRPTRKRPIFPSISKFLHSPFTASAFLCFNQTLQKEYQDPTTEVY